MHSFVAFVDLLPSSACSGCGYHLTIIISSNIDDLFFSLDHYLLPRYYEATPTTRAKKAVPPLFSLKMTPGLELSTEDVLSFASVLLFPHD